MTKMWLPTEIFSQADRNNIPAVVAELGAIKEDVLNNKAVTAEQLARVNTLMPYNLDAWDGYPAEREALYNSILALNKKLIVVAGDTHNAWHGTLKNAKGHAVGVEFATPGVTSPGMESYLSIDTAQAQKMAKALSLLINDLEYCELSQRGYMLVTLTKEEVKADWRYVDNIMSEQYNMVNPTQSVYKA